MTLTKRTYEELSSYYYAAHRYHGTGTKSPKDVFLRFDTEAERNAFTAHGKHTHNEAVDLDDITVTLWLMDSFGFAPVHALDYAPTAAILK